MAILKFLNSGSSGSGASVNLGRAIISSTIAVSDVDLSTGQKRGASGAATDDTSAYVNALSGATVPYPALLHLDGASLTKTILIPAQGNLSIEGNGPLTGFYMKTGSNGPTIHNGTVASEPYDPYLNGTAPPSSVAGSVTLSSFYVNGNAGNGTTGNATAGQGYQIPLNAAGTGTVPDAFIAGIDLRNLYQVTMTDLTLFDIACYSIFLSNVKNIQLRGIRILRKNNRPINTDGIHLDGGFTDATLSDFYIESGDDAIAVNVAEGYANSAGRLTISNGIVSDSYSLIRVYPSATYPGASIEGVKISNVIADTFILGFQLGFGSAGGSYPGPVGAIDSFVANDIKIATPLLGDISNNIKYLELSNIEWKVGNFSAYNTSSNFGGFAFLFQACTVDTLRINGVKAFYPGGTVAGIFAFDGPMTINNGSGGTTTITPHINHLIIDSLDTSNIGGIVYGQAASAIANYVDLVSGTGVLATGWEWPDSIMANGTPYLSVTSHLPSIKINGVVKTYTVS